MEPLLIWVLIGVALFAVYLRRTSIVNYRLTVVVDDNGIEHVGTGVWQFKLSRNLPVGGDSFHPVFRAEAILIELPERGTLAIIPRSLGRNGHLGSDDIMMLPEDLFRRDAERELSLDTSKRVRLNHAISGFVGRSKSLDEPPDTSSSSAVFLWPFLLRFADRKRPETAMPVNPANLAGSFGPGVRLVNAMVEITRDSITRGIQKCLPWLPEYQQNQLSLDGRRHYTNFDSDIKKLLRAGDFSTELRRRTRF